MCGGGTKNVVEDISSGVRNIGRSTRNIAGGEASSQDWLNVGTAGVGTAVGGTAIAAGAGQQTGEIGMKELVGGEVAENTMEALEPESVTDKRKARLLFTQGGALGQQVFGATNETAGVMGRAKIFGN